MEVRNNATGISIQVIIDNVQSSEPPPNQLSERVKKEHTSEHDSGQPPSESTVPTKKLPTRLVVTLSLVVVILILVLACLLTDADIFNNFLTFMSKILGLIVESN